MQQREDVGDEVTRAVFAAGVLPDREKKNHADGDRDDDLVDRRAERRRGGLFRRREAQPVRRVAQAVAFVSFTAEDLDHAMRADRFLQRMRQRAHALLHEHAHTLQAPADLPDGEPDERKRREGNQRQLPVDVEEIRQHERDRQRVPDQHRHRLGGRRRDLLRVVGDLRQQDPGGRCVVERRRQAEQAIARLAAHVEHDPRADPREPVLAHVRADAAEHEHPDDKEGEQASAVDVHLAHVVDHRAHELQHHHVGRCDEQHAEDGECEHRAVGARIAEQAAIELQGGTGKAARGARGRKGAIISEPLSYNSFRQ